MGFSRVSPGSLGPSVLSSVCGSDPHGHKMAAEIKTPPLYSRWEEGHKNQNTGEGSKLSYFNKAFLEATPQGLSHVFKPEGGHRATHGCRGGWETGGAFNGPLWLWPKVAIG